MGSYRIGSADRSLSHGQGWTTGAAKRPNRYRALPQPGFEGTTVTISLSVPRTGSAAALRLRPWRPDDLPALVAAHRDPELRRRLVTSLADEADARRWLAAQAAGWDSATRFSFAVVAEDDAPLGHIAVKVGTAGVAEVGYWTAARVRGRGIAARALETASRWALRTHLVRLTRLDLLHAEDNVASCRVAEKCGYVLHDLLPAAPPAFPARGHRHVRRRPAAPGGRPVGT